MTSRGWVAALLSGALLAVSRDTGQFGWLVLGAPVPLLVHALRAPHARHVAGPAFVAGLMAEAGPMWFYGRILPVIYGLALFQGLMFMLTVLFMRALYRRFPAGVAVLCVNRATRRRRLPGRCRCSRHACTGSGRAGGSTSPRCMVPMHLSEPI
jgi:hypothetical protein